MAAPAKPWKAEYAKSARSSCKSCKNAIQKDVLRLGKMVQATQFDGFMPVYFYCILEKNPPPVPSLFASFFVAGWVTSPLGLGRTLSPFVRR